jgi:hypothetical protein
MGDNASASWAWHNTVVGQGYQAKGVVRQPGSQSVAIVDLRRPEDANLKTQNKAVIPHEEALVSVDSERKSKKRMKEVDDSRDRKRDHKSSKKDEKKEKKSKKEKKHKKKSHHDMASDVDKPIDNFNPLLQYFAASLSNRTRSFSLENE